MKNVNRRHALLSTAAALAAPAAFAQQDNWPAKPLRLVVPYPPGGSSDIIARSVSTLLADALKQSVGSTCRTRAAARRSRTRWAARRR